MKKQKYKHRATDRLLTKSRASEGDYDKFKELLILILHKTADVPNVGKTKLFKLLYFMDFDHYEKHDRHLTGVIYMKDQYGPAPVPFDKAIRELCTKGEITVMTTEYHARKQKKYTALRDSKLDRFDKNELKSIYEVLERFKDYNAKEISEYSHNDVPWLTTQDGQAINYDSVYYRTSEYSVRDYGKEFQAG